MERLVGIFSWALYDLANQFFALNIVSLYFVRWLTLERSTPEIFYSIAFAISILGVAITAPVLGEISDHLGRRKPFLAYLTLVSVVFTMLLGASKNIFIALLFFAIANYGCQTAIVFYNALMVNIAPKNRIGLISGLGKVFGYSGAVIALYLTKPIVLKSGYQAVFLPTGFYFLIFSIPCLVFVKDSPLNSIRINPKDFLSRLKNHRLIQRLRAIFFAKEDATGITDFLRASFFVLCSVNAIILFMSVYATRVFGLDEARIIDLIAFSTIFAILGSFVSGFLSDYTGHKFFLKIIFILWIIAFILGGTVTDPRLYLAIGAIVGFSLGSTWVVSRALAMKITPEDRVGEVFGLFNLVAYLSGIIGSIFWGLVLLILSPLEKLAYRITLMSLIIFIALGYFFLTKIPDVKRN